MLKPNETLKIDNYQSYLKNRGTKGGDILTAVREGVDSIIVSDTDQEEEILTIQISIENMDVRIINAYAPQEDESKEVVISFWHALEKELVDAVESGCLIVLEFDANVKVGKTIIKNS